MAATLVTGISGSLARRVADRLVERGDTVVGVDYRPPPAALDKRIRFFQANYNKTRIEDVFRHCTFDRVLHLGRVGNLKESMGKRFDLNVVGSQKILNLCLAGGVKRLVVFSTFHIYGAHPANHIPISEEDPLHAGTDFPQIADAIQLDNMASRWVYQHRGIRTVVLRPTNVIGPAIQNAIANLLRQPRIPHLMGYNPMVQFIHEDDMAAAILAAADGEQVGIFNVAGDGVMPWRTALRLVRASTFPIPAAAVELYLSIFSRFPHYLVNFFRYPCVITDRRFREAFHWAPRIPMEDMLWSTVEEARKRQGFT
ncbi:MAG: NAD-dependent epimerase/dehydratase family protein [Deltaproteobacteria bacterium]|nr:NAD-dependent epimerase/dehydratase family protein [Deltaproteobacteria bacterium]